MTWRAPALAMLIFAGFTGEPPPEKVGRLGHEPIREASGMVASRKRPGTFWTINDSGNPPVLYAVQANGTLVREYKVGAANIDWEAIALDQSGRLLICDIGNNLKLLPLRAIYVVEEPDAESPEQGELRVIKTLRYRAPKEGLFDAEAVYVRDGKVHLIEKRLDGRPPAIYAVALESETKSPGPATPLKTGELPDFREPVTDACLDPSGKRLAVVAVNLVRIYDLGTDAWTLSRTVRFGDLGIESCAWDPADGGLVLASEDRTIYRIAADRLKPTEDPPKR